MRHKNVGINQHKLQFFARTIELLNVFLHITNDE